MSRLYGRPVLTVGIFVPGNFDMHQERTEKTNGVLDQPPLEEPDYYQNQQDQTGAEQGKAERAGDRAGVTG